MLSISSPKFRSNMYESDDWSFGFFSDRPVRSSADWKSDRRLDSLIFVNLTRRGTRAAEVSRNDDLLVGFFALFLLFLAYEKKVSLFEEKKQNFIFARKFVQNQITSYSHVKFRKIHLSWNFIGIWGYFELTWICDIRAI